MRRRKYQLPPNVEPVKAKGQLYLYYRISKGPRIRLPDDPHSREFRSAYAAAMAGYGEHKPTALRRDAPGTIGALITSYLKSAEFIELKETSKVGYMSRLNRIREDHGHRTVAGMTREGIVTKILQPFAGKPGAALDTLKKLRILITHAINIGWLKHDPSLKIKRPKTNEVPACPMRGWICLSVAGLWGKNSERLTSCSKSELLGLTYTRSLGRK